MNTSFNGSKPGPIITHNAEVVLPGPFPGFPPQTDCPELPVEDSATSYPPGIEAGDEKKSSPADIASISSAGASTRRSPIHSDGHNYPEGGLRAWLVVAGAFSAMVAALGMMNTSISPASFVRTDSANTST